jgi:YkoY family integral membrane protein
MWGIDATGFMALGGSVATLVVLEGLLSADNAMVLAVMVRNLPKEQRNRALRYGMFGAFAFRLVAVVFAASLLHYWIVKAMGGIYLLYIAISHLGRHEESTETVGRSRFGDGFWATVISVELTDIIFSVDSILAAVATAEALPKRYGEKPVFTIPGVDLVVDWKLLVIYLGGILGIIAMRFVAGYFLILLDKFRGLAAGAYYLVGWIGLKLLGGGLHDAVHPSFTVSTGNWRENLPTWLNQVPFEINAWIFWSVMALIVIVSLIAKPKPPSKTEEETKATKPTELIAMHPLE